MPLQILLALACAAALWRGTSEKPPQPLDRVRSPAHAAVAAIDLTGHWEADVTGDGRTFTFLFDFVTNGRGDVLTGTVGLSTRDETFPITEGRIKGNAISFKSFGIWTGTLVGPDLKLTRELDYGRKQQMTAHRKPRS